MEYGNIVIESNVNMFTWSYIWAGFHNQDIVKQFGGEHWKNSFIEFENDNGKWATNLEEWERLGKAVLQGIKDGRVRYEDINSNSLRIGKELMDYSEGILNEGIGGAGNEKILEWLNRLYEMSVEISTYGFVPVASDFHHMALTAELERVIKGKIERLQLKRRANEYVSILISPAKESLVESENIELFELAGLVKESIKEVKDIEEFKSALLKHPEINKKIEEHAKKYKWVNYGYQGPLYTIGDFLEEIVKILGKYRDVRIDVEKLRASKKNLKKMHEQYLAELDLDEGEKRLFDTAREFLYIKGYRMGVRHKVNYVFDRIFGALSKRFGISISELRYSTIDEIRELLKTGNMKARDSLKERRKHCVRFIEGGQTGILIGKEASEFVERRVKAAEVDEKIIMIEGSVASVGKAIGIVKIINKVEDMAKMEDGDILVSIATNPDLVPAMGKAAAFVTDTGGITSHAAIVAREMNKPCITGTKIATKVLKDGDRVEVDAIHGRVKKLS